MEVDVRCLYLRGSRYLDCVDAGRRGVGVRGDRGRVSVGRAL